MSLRTLIYARVSTEDQVEKYGLPVQFRACREFAAARGWLVIEPPISDDGISGAILERPGLERVRQLVREGAVDVVLTLDTDRLSRELVHLLILKPEIEKRARLEFVNATFDNSPSGQLFYSMKGAIAQYERAVTRDRTMRGKKERARTGLIVGGRTAYGYRYAEGKLTADEERAPIARDIFAWCDAGLSIRQIAVKLRAIGAPTYGGRKWGHSSVGRILRNETYAGVAHYGTHQREGKHLRLRVSGERIALAVPALISRELWERVQARLAANPQRGRPTRNYLLRGLLFCGACGCRMTGDTGKGYSSYRCGGRDTLRHSDRAVCRAKAKAPLIDAAVWNAVARAFTDAAYLRQLLARHQRSLQSAGPQRVPALALQVAKLKRKESACLQSLLDPELADARASIKAEYARVQTERKRLEEEMGGIEQAKQSALSAGAWLEETVELLREYVPSLESIEDRQAFLRGAVQRAEWSNNGEVKIECLFGAEMSTSSARCDRFAPLKLILTARVAA